jgi:hypothetical protein
VNSYFALCDGEFTSNYEFQACNKVKEKGFYVTQRVLDMSSEFLVIPLAVQAYFLKGTKPEEFVKNHKILADFCSQKKSDRSYTIKHNGIEVQRLNRFYPSTKGAYLYKEKVNKKTNKLTSSHLFSESGVTIVNRLPEEFPTNVNYKWFISEIKKHIACFESDQLSLF